MSAHANPLVSKVELANTLRQLRTAAGKTLEDAAGVLEMSVATVSRIETGVRIPKARDVRELCRYYGVQDEGRIDELAALVAGARAPGWWERYPDAVDDLYGTFIALEEAAQEIQQLSHSEVPALLQTSEYQQAYLQNYGRLYWDESLSAEAASARVEVRSKRQRILSGAGELNRYSVVLPERVLRLDVGGPAVMKGQLASMMELMKRERLDLRILSDRELGYAGPIGSFTILMLPQDQISDIVYLDLLHGQTIIDDNRLIANYRRVFEGLRAIALSSEESLCLLHRMIDER